MSIALYPYRVVYLPENSCKYGLAIENGSEEKEKFEEHTESPTFSVDEYKLIQDYLRKLDAAKWQTKSVDLDALPE
ncbi:hypothetical protein [Nostoc sp. CHAB 5715]|uniref:hypothetical protein n=1 Tax=Nostoc sp. CHAB 5715 TaxID=2780400 RepID=UPI001E44005E|nr:hypothetical protein [Nostoc sp. CHAB 5715]MCC5626192.1 hypothetical protein [Nostoc sp. CHAB 5715]